MNANTLDKLSTWLTRATWISFAIIFIVFYLPSCGGNTGSYTSVPSPTFTGGMRCDHKVTSTKGVTICSGDTIPSNVPTIVDQQLDDLFTIAQNGQTTASGVNNYHRCASGAYEPTHNCFSTWATYFVWLIPQAKGVCVNPGFTEVVNSDPWPDGYDETYSDSPNNHWDKDPRPAHTLLCVLGFMATGGGGLKGLAAPGMGVVDAVDQMPIVRYEGEHNLLAQVDTNRYAATQYHFGANGGHPILGDGSGSALKAATLPKQDRPTIQDDAGRTLWVTK